MIYATVLDLMWCGILKLKIFIQLFFNLPKPERNIEKNVGGQQDKKSDHQPRHKLSPNHQHWQKKKNRAGSYQMPNDAINFLIKSFS